MLFSNCREKENLIKRTLNLDYNANYEIKNLQIAVLSNILTPNLRVELLLV